MAEFDLLHDVSIAIVHHLLSETNAFPVIF